MYIPLLIELLHLGMHYIMFPRSRPGGGRNTVRVCGAHDEVAEHIQGKLAYSYTSFVRVPAASILSDPRASVPCGVLTMNFLPSQLAQLGLVLLLVRAEAVAPADEDEVCNTLTPESKSFRKVLLDSWRYQTLFSSSDSASVWTTYSEPGTSQDSVVSEQLLVCVHVCVCVIH